MTNYTMPTNITGFPEALDYTKNIVIQGSGIDFLMPLLLGVLWIAFTIVASKYSQERAFVYSTFMTTIVAFLMVSGNMLDPSVLIICMVGLIASVYFSRSD